MKPYEVFDTWKWIVSEAWAKGVSGDYPRAAVLFQISNEVAMGNAFLPPFLEIARHRACENIEDIRPDERLIVQPFGFDEDEVWGLTIESRYQEWPNYESMRLMRVDEDSLAWNMERFMQAFDASEVAVNVLRDLPHVMFMSTGRCGTVSAAKLFGQYGLAYHVYPYSLPADMHYDMLCRLVDERWDTYVSPVFWAKTRMAEWLGGMINNQPVVMTSHRDTIFAPVMAAIHSKSKFVYLKRDEEDTFLSFYTKSQWSKSQIGPVYYDFEANNDFRWRQAIWDISEMIAWNLKFTAAFCRAFGSLMGDRFIEISSDKLFAQDLDEVKKLVDFVGFDIPFKEAVSHFKTAHNSKAHKVIVSERMINNALRTLDRPLNEQVLYERIDD